MSDPSSTPTVQAPRISVQGVTMRFGDVEALHRVDLDFRENEFVAVVGAADAARARCSQSSAGCLLPRRAMSWLTASQSLGRVGIGASSSRPRHCCRG